MRIKNHEFIQSLDDMLSQLRAELHLEGIKLLEKDPRQSGNNVQIQCPYHSNGRERKPSMGIRKDTGICHCFTCDTTVGLDEFISNCFGYNDNGYYGWSWLLKNFLFIQGEFNVEIDYSSSDNSVDTCDYVSDEELDRYRFEHSYWAKRGITDSDLKEFFDLGYDKETKCITMPVRDVDGNCLFVARRSVKTKFFNYPSGVTKPVYGIYELYYGDEFPNEVWITESIIDCLRLWQVGKFACALNGLGTKLQYQELNDMPCVSFVLATDMDEAGQRARKKLRDNIKGHLIYEVYFEHKDIGEMTDEEILQLKPTLF